MACITCPECGKEVSSEAKNCIHCGYPLKKKKKPKVSRKIIAAACAALLILVYFSFFHLGADDKYAYDLVIQNSMYLENPQSIRVISGTAGFNPDRGTPYAFLRVSFQNPLGGKTSGCYILGEDGVSDASGTDLYVKFCNERRLNTKAINIRLMLYWIF